MERSCLSLLCLIFVPISAHENGISDTPKIVILGGNRYPVSQANKIEVYHPFNPQLNRVLPVTLRKLRYGHSSVLVYDGSILTMTTSTNLSDTSCERLYPHNNRITNFAPLNKPHGYGAAATIDGIPFICGGFDEGRKPTRWCEYFFFDLSTAWRHFPALNSVRTYFAMVSLNGSLYAMGGWEGFDPVVSRTVEKWKPLEESWRFVQPMNIPRAHHSAAFFGGKIVVCGGTENRKETNSCEEYDAVKNMWSAFPSMNKAHKYLNLVSFEKYLFAVGDEKIEMFDGKVGKWVILPEKPLVWRIESAAVVIP